LHELLLENRYEAVEKGNPAWNEKLAWKIWKRVSLSRTLMNMGNAKIKNRMVNRIFKGWTAHRGDLYFSEKTFNEMWKERVSR
jgi:L-lactate dehydrogenase complex protein LldF